MKQTPALGPDPRIEALEIRAQKQLSLQKSFRFCRKGISYRLFRSSLTLAVVVVAVAFFMVLLSESVMTEAIGRGIRADMQEVREADVLLNHLFAVPGKDDFRRQVALASGTPPKIRELHQVTRLPEERINALAGLCRLEQTYLGFFESLRPAKRLVLVKKHRGQAIFSYLKETLHWQEFLTDLGQLKSVRLPTEGTRLRGFLDSMETFHRDMEALRDQWLRSVSSLKEELKALGGEKTTAEWMAEATDEQTERWRQAVSAHGFILPPEKMKRVKESLTVAAWEAEISGLLQMPEKRAQWKQIFHSSPKLTDKMLLLPDPRVDSVLDGRFSRKQRTVVRETVSRRLDLRQLMLKIPPRKADDDRGFLNGRQILVISISFLVCMVGITNAMLMSITERFREIATMKCIGATDGFILRQFLIEAALQGLVGGTLGMTIGLLVAMLKTGLVMGGSLFAFFPGVQLLFCGLATVLIGVFLAMLASIYPSVAAARMAPMEAMRVE